MTTRTLTVEREMAHKPEKIWRALTQGPLIEEWLMATDFEPVVGRTFKLTAKPQPHWDGVITCRVITVDAPRELSYTWSTLGLDTVVTWTLTPTATGTMVRMEQSGFGADQENNFRGAAAGWTRNLAALERVVGGIN